MNRHWITTPALALVLALGAGACGSDAPAADVASIKGTTAPAAADDEGGGGEGDQPTQEETEEAMLAFAQCMREHGIDMPDPDPNGGGAAVRVGGGSGEDGPTREEFEAADGDCRPLMEGVVGAPQDLSPEERAEMQDSALAMAQCMRDAGFDMPDPIFGEDGTVQQILGDGVDPASEEFQEAQEACAEEAGMPGGGMVVSGGPMAGSDSGPGNSTSGSTDEGDEDDE